MTAALPAGLRRSVRDVMPLFASVMLLMAGNGLTSTLLGIRSGLEGFSESVIGIVLAGYYLGFFVGSVMASSAIRRVGHIRVFAGLASLASCAVILHVVRADPLTWFLLRALAGLCTSGLYLVTEAWLNAAATNATRGGLMAGYMVVVTGGLAAGQFLFAASDPTGPAGFVVGSVLVSLAVVPVALATILAPDIPEPQPMSLRELIPIAPLGPLGSAVSGFAGAVMIGGGAVYASAARLGQVGTAALISAALVGGLALQIPLGRWSDRVDRRRVMVAASFAGVAAAGGATLLAPDSRAAVILLTLVAGGITYPLYSLASSHLNDYLESGRVVAAGARMILINALGAVAGPVVGASAIHAFGPPALFGVLGSSYLVVGVAAIVQIRRRPPVAESERASYVPVPLGTAPAAAALVEGYAAELYPVTRGTVPVGARTLEFAEQGTGLPLILVGDRGAGIDMWEDALTSLAADGHRAIAVSSDSTPQSARTVEEDLHELLKAMDLPSANVVGAGTGADYVAEFAEAHPDRVATVVLVRPRDQARADALISPTLVIEQDPSPERDPEAFADEVTEFLRRHLATRPAEL